MLQQCLQGIVSSFHFLLGQEDMDLFVTGPAKPGRPMMKLLPVKGTLSPAIPMPRPRNEMMARHLLHHPAAKLTSMRTFHEGFTFRITWFAFDGIRKPPTVAIRPTTSQGSTGIFPASECK